MGLGARIIEVAFDSEPMDPEAVKKRLEKDYSAFEVVGKKELRGNARPEFAQLHRSLKWAVRVTLSATQGIDNAKAHVGKICSALGVAAYTRCAWFDSWEVN